MSKLKSRHVKWFIACNLVVPEPTVYMPDLCFSFYGLTIILACSKRREIILSSEDIIYTSAS